MSLRGSPAIARRLGGVVLLATVLSLGCGSRPVVSGKVTYKQDVLTAGEVSFVSADGRSRSGLIGADGRYEIVDPPAGEVTIVVVATRVEAARKTDGSAFAGAPTDRGPAVKSLIPSHYGDPKTSGLKYVVGSGRQSKDVELE